MTRPPLPADRPGALVRLGRRLPARVRRALQPAARAVRRRRPVHEAAPARAPYVPLDEIGLRTGTDKSSKIHDYLGVYEKQLRPLRNKEFQLVEIGVHKGSSTRMWAEYFQRAQVIGIDIDPACKQLEGDRIKVIIGNQGKPQFLDRMSRRLKPLVLIDDGSHRWKHQIDTFRALFPIVENGGYFICEDIHTSFGDDYADSYGTAGTETAYDYFAGIARGIVAGGRADPPRDEFEAYCRTTIESIVFLKHSLVVKKRDFKQRVYRTRSVTERADHVVTTDLGPVYPRIPAQLVNVTPYVAARFDEIQAAGPVTYPPATSGVMSDVTVVSSGLALHGDDTILDETLNAARNVRRAGQLYRPTDGQVWVNAEPVRPRRVRAEPGKHHVLLKQTWDANYGHWLVDALPKVGLAAEVHAVEDCLFVLNEQKSEAMRKVVLDSLALAGVTGEQALFLDITPRRFERLTIPGTITRHPLTKSPFAIRYLERLAEQVEPSGHQRIYVSRNLGNRRRLVNEDDVLKVLSEHDYLLVHPETLSLREQMAIFRSATHVVGNLGAGLANLAFSPQDVTVLALTTERMNHDYFYDIVCHKAQGRYRGLQGRAEAAEPDISSDFTIDLSLLEESLVWAHH